MRVKKRLQQPGLEKERTRIRKTLLTRLLFSPASLFSFPVHRRLLSGPSPPLLPPLPLVAVLPPPAVPLPLNAIMCTYFSHTQFFLIRALPLATNILFEFECKINWTFASRTAIFGKLFIVYTDFDWNRIFIESSTVISIRRQSLHSCKNFVFFLAANNSGLSSNTYTIDVGVVVLVVDVDCSTTPLLLNMSSTITFHN